MNIVENIMLKIKPPIWCVQELGDSRILNDSGSLLTAALGESLKLIGHAHQYAKSMGVVERRTWVRKHYAWTTIT